MDFIILFLCFSYLFFRYIKQYKETGKKYKLLYLIPVISVIIIESISKFTHKQINIVLCICVFLVYIILGIVDLRLKKTSVKQ